MILAAPPRHGRINNNPDIRGGGVGSVGSPIFILPEDASTGVVEIIGNTITQVGQDPGILAVTHGDGAGPSADNGTLDITIRDNTITLTANAGGNVGIDTRAGSNAGDLSQTFVDVHNNAVTLADAGVDFAWLAREGSNTAQLYLENFQSGASNTARAVATWNANGNTPTGSAISIDASGALAYAAPPAGHNGGHVMTPSHPNALLAASGGVGSASGRPGEMHLTQTQLDGIVAAAMEHWAAAGLSAQQIATLHRVTYDVGDLMGGWVGASTPGHVTVDVEADGHGWFVDPTPKDNSEFGKAVSATRLQAAPTAMPAGHMDLLTIVMHEMGEQLGLEDLFAPANRDELMYLQLPAGERRLPSALVPSKPLP